MSRMDSQVVFSAISPAGSETPFPGWSIWTMRHLSRSNMVR